VTREAVLARTMVELADNLVDDFDIVELLSTLSERCVEILDIAAAGIMLADGEGNLRAMTSSNEAMRIVELFEVQSQEGPCLDCYRTGRPVVNQDLRASNGRWPRFAPVAVGAGFLAADAIPMRLRGQIIGALNLFRTATGSLDHDDVAIAQALADLATIAILQNRVVVEQRDVNAQLNAALSSRIVIEQAKGMIAERQQLPVDQAFDRLRRYARNHNLRLADVARDTVAGTTDLDTFTGSSPDS
jgi:GAF domain-containing protein